MEGVGHGHGDDGDGGDEDNRTNSRHHGVPAQAKMTADPLPRSETEASPRQTEQSGITPQYVIRGTWVRPCCLFQSLSSRHQGPQFPPAVHISVPYISLWGAGGGPGRGGLP